MLDSICSSIMTMREVSVRAFEFLLPEHLSSKLVQVFFETCKTHHLTKWLLVEALFRHFLPPIT
jgi:hypothetical protein